MEKLILIGAGGYAKSVLDSVDYFNYEVAGFIDEFLKMFSYSFMVRALFIGGLVALCSSVLGVVLVLKRYSMIGDGLSHVSFGAMAIALAFIQAPLYIAIRVVMVAAYLLLRISENSKV